jgi:hypothetical protein
MTTKLALLAGALVAVVAVVAIGSKLRRSRRIGPEGRSDLSTGAVNPRGDVASEDRDGVWADDGGAPQGTARARATG